ncbi:MAG: hypothetical protein ABSB74_06595 [Tepidisphaeraceae bacterium]|jgi:predicted protein tyrosine phosphatase
MEFIVRDRESVEQGILVRSSYILISIRDPERQKVRVPKQSGLRDVLYLAFHDVDPAGGAALAEDVTLMTEEDARRIWLFVKKWEKKIGTVVVHCEQGMSRSPAVAAAVCKSMGGDDRPFWQEYRPNRYVYRLMLDCQLREDKDPER